MKVFITGASGLLGSRMLAAFPQHWEVTGAYCTRPGPGLVQCMLGNPDSVRRLIGDGGYDWVVHCAAIRSADQCRRDARKAMEVNACGTELVALAAGEAGARLAYASTDYVFGGDDPPYRETDRPGPLNVYGHSKLAGERHTLSVPGGLVVRMPALYSLDLSAPNNVLADLRSSLAAGQHVAADNDGVRHYTLAEEVAAAFAFLMERGHRGVIHVSADRSSTKLGFLRAAAQAMGLDAGLVGPAEPDPGKALRPRDAHLDSGLYRSLGGPALAGYRDALRRLEGAGGPVVKV
jgi:dTDP-4-dehydrorhamnose reductase